MGRIARARKFRDVADELRTKAEEMSSDLARRSMLSSADAWDKMADREERRLRVVHTRLEH